ncbi:LAC12 Lactose permease [Candida maltosa Xu316]|uniref:Major facilitator superfamily (MFS) profile domain-containing protein n=1 Tax=Candida maltosa (strain Xu316) TaxID=1245528 RepID=M3JV24_CANMX|nr:hypothetical protein G210_2964 [Candida maltosa Xu316]
MFDFAKKDIGTDHIENASPSNSIDKNIEHAVVEETIDDYIYLDKPFYKYWFFNLLHWYIFVNTLSSTSNGYDGSLLNGLQIISHWRDKMGTPTGAVLGALANGAVFGGFASFALASWFSDRFGRKPAILIGQVISILGAILQGVSTNYGFFLAARIILGFGTGFTAVASPCLISELAYPKYRDTATSSYNNFWYLGSTIAAWVTYGTHTMNSNHAWRIPSYLQGAIPLFQIVCILISMPESPRFLVSKGKVDQARAIIRKLHTGDDYSEKATAFVEFELKEIQAALEMEKINANSNYMDFIKFPTYRKRLFLVVFTGCFMQLSGNGLVSYYLNKVLDTIGYTEAKKQLQINGCLMIYNLVLCWCLTSVVHLFRRRTLFLSSAIWMLICYVLWTILSARFAISGFTDNGLAKAVLAFIFLYYLGYNAGCNVLPFLFTSEVLPYSHRAKGLNVLNLTINTTLIYNGFVNPIAMDAIQWKYYIVYCCILAVETVVIFFFFVETSGYSLEEVARVFGDDPSQVMPHGVAVSEKSSLENKESV